MNNNDSKEKDKVSIKNLLPKRDWIIIGAFFAAVLILLIYTFFTPNYYKGAEPKRFEIMHGETLNEVINALYQEGVIPSRRNLRITSFLFGGEKSVKAGRYQIPNGLSYVALMDLLVNGPRELPILITIPEGATTFQLASILKNRLHADSARVIALTSDTSMIRRIGADAGGLEGYLLPDSYYFYDYTSPEEVIMKLGNEFNRFFADSLKERARQMKYSIKEILTVASIVDGESNKTEEFPKIAGVYYNRLKAGMKLQADPTVQYAYQKRWRRLYNKDLLINSPYNTYLHYGLPPGPINNPGRAAILAALYPENHNYIYFVADGKGGHVFTTNYSDHLNAVRDYRLWLQNQTLK